MFEEVIDYLNQERGVLLVPVSEFIYEGNVDILGQSFNMQIDLGKGFPKDFPVIRIINSTQFIPHSSYNGCLCLIDKDSVMIKPNMPNELLLDSFDRAVDILKMEPKEQLQEVFREFYSYWEQIARKDVLLYMNLPNKLTCLRMVMIPFFVLFMYLPFPAARYIALVIFIAASLTDTADGYIARRDHLITDFGKFMDPLADKMLVISAMICLVSIDRIPAWIVIVIVAREFIISGFRLIAADKGVVIAASYWGKFKTVFQMAMVILMIANIPELSVLTQIVMWIALALTVISLIDYLRKNWNVIGSDM